MPNLALGKARPMTRVGTDTWEGALKGFESPDNLEPLAPTHVAHVPTYWTLDI